MLSYDGYCYDNGVKHDLNSKQCSMKIYVAHEYGRRHGKSDIECEINTWKAINIGRKLIELGHNPLVPNLWHFIAKDWKHSAEDESMWYDLVSSWIEDCDALFVGKYPEWENSGVQQEIELADTLGVPVYWNLEDIPKVL